MEKSRLIEAFKKRYIIPCFQREYSWTDDEIEELIENIRDAKDDYCLGVITIKNEKNENILIDGQQRLTTLYMIAIRCGYITKPEEVNLESELTTLLPKNKNNLYYLLEDKEDLIKSNNLYRGWKTIKNNIKDEDDKENIKRIIENQLYYYEINLNDSIDINHYFEVMNSRGVQLSRSDIIKSLLMSKLSDNPENQTKLNNLWYNFEKMNADSNIIKDFDSITKKDKNEYKSINAIIKENKKNGKKIENNEEENDNSILNFEFFLLYVIRLYNHKEELPDDYKGEFNLKDMIKEYENTFKNSTSEEVISFLNFMIEIKTIYNDYVIKNKGNTDNWKIKKSNNKRMKNLQACMRVSFVNRRVMHWLYITLGYFYKSKDINKYIEYMEKYIIEKYVEKYQKYAENLNYRTGFDTPIIVFNYIDYWMKFNKEKVVNIIPEAKGLDFENFTFKFRNSIEHFMPRHKEDGSLNPDWVHDIGNLALLSYATNTRMQNAYPEVKAKHFEEAGLSEYSLKLQIMTKITKKWGWDVDPNNYMTKKTKEIINQIINEIKND